MSVIVGRAFAEVHILKKKSETGPFLYKHVDILIKFGIQNDLDKKWQEIVPGQRRPFDTRVFGDVTARRSKIHGEIVSLKRRPVRDKSRGLL